MSNIMTKIAQETNGKSFKTFKYSFDSLDGSRRACKVDDISYRNQVYHVIAG